MELEEFDNCEYCTQCETLNDDVETFCHLHKRIVHEVCVNFEHFQGKERSTEEVTNELVGNLL